MSAPGPTGTLPPLRGHAVSRFARGLPLLATCATILTISLAGVLTYDDYGISTDEYIEAGAVLWHAKSVSAGLPWTQIRADLEYYGIWYNVVSAMPYVLNVAARDPELSASDIYTAGLRKWRFYESKHFFTFAFCIIAYLAVALLTRDLLEGKHAWIGIAILALTPRFWGHSFYNPKDAPFAALFALAVWASARFTAAVLDSAELHRDRRRLYLLAACVGILTGLLTGIRVGGVVMLGFIVMAHVTLSVLNRTTWRIRDLRSQAGPYLLLVALAITVAIAVNPVSWQSPVAWFSEAIAYHSNHEWDAVTLTLGDYWRGSSTPPIYLPVWFGVTTPIATMALTSLGWFATLAGLRRTSSRKRSTFVWLSLMMLSLPLFAVLNGSTLYSGVRQFLFVLPPAAAFATAGIEFALRRAGGRYARLMVAIVFVAYSLVAIAMVRLHPYQAVYFNTLARGGNIEREFETDYWALSTREAMEWIAEQPGSRKAVYFHAPYRCVKPYAGEDVLLIKLRGEMESTDLRKPFYYLAYPRNTHGDPHHPLDYFPDCRTVFRVQRPLGRDSLSLTVVKRCE